MKYLITESQFDNIVFKYLDNQDFIGLDIGGIIYIVNSKDDEYALIKCNIKLKNCEVSYDLINEISSFFSISREESETIIGQWTAEYLGIDNMEMLVKVYSKSMILKLPFRYEIPNN